MNPARDTGITSRSAACRFLLMFCAPATDLVSVGALFTSKGERQMRWTVSKKLALGFGVIIVFVIIIGAVALTNIDNLITHQNQGRTYVRVRQTTRELLALGNYGNGVLRTYYIALSDPSERLRVRTSCWPTGSTSALWPRVSRNGAGASATNRKTWPQNWPPM